MDLERKKQYQADSALLLVSFVWGITFVVVKDALADISPFYFLTFRFGVATLFLGLIFIKQILNTSLREICAGFSISLFLFGGYAFQTVGLQYTGAANAGFITGLAVILVPLFVTLSSRKLPTGQLTIGVLSSVVGLALLSLNRHLTFNYGDLLVFFCALCYAGHILMVGRFTSRYDPVRLTIIQIASVSVISLLFSVALETPPSTLTGPVWTALLVTSIPATSLAFLVQNKAQKFTSTIHTAVIFTTEPVFAGLAAFVLAGEVLSGRQLVGCVLILMGMLIVSIKGSPSKKDHLQFSQ